MATLLQIRTNVVKDTGRVELVTDAAAGTYTDNGLDRHIQAAQRWLDRKIERKPHPQRIQRVVEAGEYLVEAGRLRHIQEVDISDGEALWRLERKPIEWLRKYYAQPVAQMDNARPVYWTRAARMSDVGQNELMVDPGFTYDPLVGERAWWEALTGSAVSWNSVQESIDWANVGSPVSSIQTLDTVYIDVANYTYTLRINWDPYGTGTASAQFVISFINSETDDEYLILGTPPTAETDGEIVEWDLQFWAEYADIQDTMPAGDYYVRLKTDGFATTNDIRVKHFSIISTQPTTDLEDAVTSHDSHILVLPPSDAQYTVTMHGGFYSEVLEDDEDVSWWSDQHPDVLEDATKMMLEMRTNRNSQGVADYQAQLLDQIREIYHDIVSEEIAGDRDSIKMGEVGLGNTHRRGVLYDRWTS